MFGKGYPHIVDKLIFIHSKFEEEVWDSGAVEWIPVVKHFNGEGESGRKVRDREGIHHPFVYGEVL